MVGRLISKYALATHLALLVGLPIALTPFVSVETLSYVCFLLSGLTFFAFLLEPSLRHREHIGQARARAFSSAVRDPVVWLFIIAAVFAFIRWLNDGVVLAYDPMESAWAVKEPAASALPASTPGAGFPFFAVSVAVLVAVVCIRNGLGASARVWTGLCASGIAGAGGLVWAFLAWFHTGDFAAQVGPTFADFEAGKGLLFGGFLPVAVMAGASLSVLHWGFWARVFFLLGVAGNLAAVLLFTPALVAVAFLVPIPLFAIFALVYSVRGGAKGHILYTLVFFLVAVALGIGLYFSYPIETVRNERIEQLNPKIALTEERQEIDVALSRIARAVWLEKPWLGKGIAAYALLAPFHAEKNDWMILPPEPKVPLNGFWQLLAERGILGAVLFGVGLLSLAVAWFVRLVKGVVTIRDRAKDHDMPAFIFCVEPVVWVPFWPVAVAVAACYFSPVFSLPTLVLAFAPICALAASSFPRKKEKH